MAVGGTKVVQVTNIAPQATKDQMQTLFGYLGKIDDIRLYPTVRDVSCPVQSRICYIKFMDSNTVGIAQHMTNTVFIDRALIVIPVQNGDIPDEYYALEMTRNGTIVPGLCPSEPKLPPNVVNTISGTGLEQVILTSDPQLDAHGLPPYPPLPVSYDSTKIEEVRRTILLGNVEMSTTVAEIAEFFAIAGEVKYIRTCRRASDASEYFLVEFTEQASILNALKLNSNELKGRNVSIRHSTQAIVKPQAKSNEAAQREIEEAMSRVKEAQSLISAAIDPVIGMLSKDKRSVRRSRSRSRGRRRRSRSRSRSRRSRSRGGRRRSRSRSRDRRRRSRSRHRSRSRSRRSASREKRRSRSRSPSKTKTTRKRSKERRSRDKSKERKSREKSRERSSRRDVDKKERRERDRDNDDEKEKKRSRSTSRPRYRSRERSREKSSRSKDKKRDRSRSKDRKRRSASRDKRKRSRSKSKDKEKKRERRERKERSRSRSKIPRNYDEEEKGFDSEKERSASRHGSETIDKESEKSDNMDISNSP